MGVMIEGRYQAEEPARRTDAGGRYAREKAAIRDWIGEVPFAAEPGRYHLYLAWNCPWAHRALLARNLLGLQEAVGVSYAAPLRTEEGWVFEAEGPYSDPELGVRALHEVYARQPEPYTGRITTPVLWDRETGRIVSNESADIVRMLNTFPGTENLRPSALADSVDEWNDLIHDTLNEGVYKAGFATTQEAYDEAVTAVFETLDKIEARLHEAEWLAGHLFTEADLRLFPTLVRFDVAYHYAFKCNIHRITDYPALWRYARWIYAMPGVEETVDFEIYKRGYFSPSKERNPLGIIPAGPKIDWSL